MAHDLLAMKQMVHKPGISLRALLPAEHGPGGGRMESWRTYVPAAATLAVLGLGAWAGQLAGAPLGIVPAEHGAFMLWGVLGTGVMGFLYTAYAKQNDATLPGPLWLHGTLTLQGVGALGLLGGAPALALPAWALLLGWCLRVAVPSLRRRWDDTTAAVPAVILAAIVGLAVHTTEAAPVGGLGPRIAVHGWLVPLALAVLDRVLPFFSSRVTPGYAGGRAPWFLGPLVAVSWVGLLPLPGAAWAPVGLLGLLARQWWAWRPWPAARTPMILVLHLGVAWFAVGWGLAWAGASASVVTHALVLGGLGSLLLAISMRVVRGHGGLPLELGFAGVGIVVLGHTATVLRLLGVPLTWAAAALIAAFALWLVRFAGTCLRVKSAL